VSDDVEAVMAGARVLAALTAQSMAAVEDVVTLPQLRILVMVASCGAPNLAAVAARLGVPPTDATRAVEAMVTTGLLGRRDDPTDRRNLILELTPKGHELVKQVMDERRAAIADILGRMPASRRRSLVAGMRAFAESGGETYDNGAVWSLGWTTKPPH
jgi:DNA-binding MarR family transcriptional regulator